MTTAELTTEIRAAFAVDSEPMPAMPIVDRLIRPCACGAGHEPQGSRCDLWPVCYGNAGYTMADEPTELLVRKGSAAVWEWLETAYLDNFPDPAVTA